MLRREADRDFAVGFALAVVSTLTVYGALWAAHAGYWPLVVVLVALAVLPWSMVAYLFALAAVAAVRVLWASRADGMTANPLDDLRGDYMAGRIDLPELERRYERVLEARRGS